MTSSRLPWLIVLGLTLLLIIILVHGWLGHPEIPVVSPPPDTVSNTQATAHRPSEKPPSLAGRIKTKSVGVAREVSSGTPDTAYARHYARKVFEAESLRAVLARIRREGGDTNTVAVAVGVLPPVAGRYDGKHLRLWLTESNGRVLKATARLRPHFEFRAGLGGLSDTVPVMREDRWWLRQARETLGCLPAASAVALAGALLDRTHTVRTASVGGVLALAACLSD
jgi:hypothetical protein